LRPNKSFFTALLFSPVNLIPCYLRMIPEFYFFPPAGNPFAITVFMILVIIRMGVFSEKRKELSQTIASLMGSLRTEKGCLRCNFCQNIEDENELYLLEEWDSQENLMRHQKSERFRILLGAMNLLKRPYEMMVHTCSRAEGIKEGKDRLKDSSN
jgi:quinol monooxygenase YgiN